LAPREFRSTRSALRGCCVAGLILLAGCDAAEEQIAPEIRPVRVVSVDESAGAETVTLTGTIRAETEVSLSFRIGGRLIERQLNVGDRVEAGQLVARIDAEDDENALRAARADYTAARGQLVEARNHYERQRNLLDGWITRARYDEALQLYQTAQSRLDSAQAQVRIAENRVSWTELLADTAGIVTARGAETGEVVQAGQMIYQVAREDGRDAVFDVPQQAKDRAPPHPEITVFLTANRAIQTVGRIREVSPQADPTTGTFEVRVGLVDPPAAMRLGATVTGEMAVETLAGIGIPASALTRKDANPAVWVVDPETQTVALREIDLLRHDPARVVVGDGLEPGEIVVTAGVQALRPGQQVRLLGEGT